MQGAAPGLVRRSGMHMRAAIACTPAVKLLLLCRPADMLPLPAACAIHVRQSGLIHAL